MGCGSWTPRDWDTYSKSSIAGKSAAGIYTSRSVKPEFDPKGIPMRESRDSDDHPNSNAIIIGLDVTGSMSDILEGVATYQRDIYLPKRLKELGVSNISLDDLGVILSENIIDNWIAQANEMMDYCHVVNDDIVHVYDGLVFEGAQGLLLDEMYEEFAPHLTTSRTGIPGVNRVLYSARLRDCRDIEMCFVSRTYFTRHGAGFFPTECSAKDLFGEDKQDATNVWNEFQGSFRYGYFEEDRFRNVCGQEVKRAKRMYPYTKLSFAFTHADETDGMVLESFGHKEIKDVVSPLSPDCFYTSIGNTRQHVIETPLKTHRKSQ